MYRTHCVFVLVALCAVLVDSFSWDIVTADTQLRFYDIYGNLTHIENTPLDSAQHVTYDPVHNRVLFADYENIYSFDIATWKTEYLIKNITNSVSGLAYDPVTQLVFWVENYEFMYSISLKAGFNHNKVNEKHLILSQQDAIRDIAVDSCGGFIYWRTNPDIVHRVRFNGSEIEVVMYHDCFLTCLTIDQQSQKMYFSDTTGDGLTSSIKTSDLNGKNQTTLISSTQLPIRLHLAVSKDFIYGQFYEIGISQMPKNPPRGTEVRTRSFTDAGVDGIATNYDYDITRGIQNCDTLKSPLPNNSVSTDVSLLCVHGTKVSGESRCECAQGYSGERCDVSVCHNYCLHGDCSASAEGQAQCRCNAGYSGERCEVNACQSYCLNGGVCSLSEESKPVCQCTGGHEGDRCEVPAFLTKCVQTVSMLRDLLNTDVTSFKVVKSTPSTVV